MKTANVKQGSGGSKRLWTWVLLGSLMALTVDLGLIKAAKADIRVRARVHTPHVSVDIGNHGAHRGRHHGPNDGCVVSYRVTKDDRKIARRLAKSTGYRVTRLLTLRQHGYSWNQIGYELGISNQTMRLAMRGPDWNQRRWAGSRVTVSTPPSVLCRRPAYGR